MRTLRRLRGEFNGFLQHVSRAFARTGVATSCYWKKTSSRKSVQILFYGLDRVIECDFDVPNFLDVGTSRCFASFETSKNERGDVFGE